MAVQVEGYRGVAWRVVKRTRDEVTCVMIGDDRRFIFDPADVKPLKRTAYCAVCGQIGCGHDGLER